MWRVPHFDRAPHIIARQHCDIYLTLPMNSLKPLPLPSLHSSFTPNWKHCSLANPILIHHLPHTSLPVSTPNTIAVWLRDCLLAWISGSWPLAIAFVLVKRLWSSWFPWLRFCWRSRNLEFTITITIKDYFGTSKFGGWASNVMKPLPGDSWVWTQSSVTIPYWS